jgi:two-component system, cell cycle response regulator DivK
MDVASSPPFRRPDIFALLVDRDEGSRRLYAEYLSVHACTIEQAADGREALAKALARHHDVIVVEPRLPGIDGYQLCGLLRRDQATEMTPILVVTGDAYASDIDRAYRVGATAVLTKPCLPETLWSQICKLLDTSPGAPGDGEGGAPGNDDPPSAANGASRRAILSRVHQRGDTLAPPKPPPVLVCPVCDTPLAYQRSHVGGVSARHAEQWDYYDCPNGCGTFQYRQRTRKIRRAC